MTIIWRNRLNVKSKFLHNQTLNNDEVQIIISHNCIFTYKFVEVKVLGGSQTSDELQIRLCGPNGSKILMQFLLGRSVDHHKIYYRYVNSLQTSFLKLFVITFQVHDINTPYCFSGFHFLSLVFIFRL